MCEWFPKTIDIVRTFRVERVQGRIAVTSKDIYAQKKKAGGDETKYDKKITEIKNDL